MSDAVNPSHYRAHPSGVECIDVAEKLGFNLGNAIKYLWRAGLKENAPTLQDFKKARWYLERATGHRGWVPCGSAMGPIQRVLACPPSTLTAVLVALFGTMAQRDASVDDVYSALAIVHQEVERMERTS